MGPLWPRINVFFPSPGMWCVLTLLLTVLTYTCSRQVVILLIIFNIVVGNSTQEYKYYNLQYSDYFRGRFDQNQISHPQRSNYSQLKYAIVNLSKVFNSFVFNAVKFWNKVPLHIKIDHDLNIFKRYLRTEHFDWFLAVIITLATFHKLLSVQIYISVFMFWLCSCF